MYKLLIVDDDMLARAGMKMLIDWNTYGYQVIDLVDSGEAALEVISREKPDVVFTDVVMHGMDGIELTRRIKEQYPEIIVVALSCYSDVEYVKNIVKMGAEDYLQKLSFSPDDVIALLTRLTILLDSRNSKEGNNNKQICSQLLLKLIHEEMDDDNDLVSNMNMDYETERGIFVIRRRSSWPSNNDMMKRIEDILASNTELVFCFARMLEEQIVVFYDWKNYKEWLKISEIIAKDYREVAIGFSRPWRNQTLTSHLHEAEEAAKSVYLHDDIVVHTFVHENKESLNAVYQEFDVIQSMLANYDFSALLSELEKLKVCMKKLVSHPTICVQMFSSVSAKLMQLSMMLEGDAEELAIIPHETAGTLEESLQIVLRQAQQLQENLSNSPERYHPEVKKAIAYIMEHYREEITLSQIAVHVSFSESYLSSIFKKDTGKGIINYLEEYRIKQALRLMNEQREPLYLIALNVGYSSVGYFSRVFKKVRHETPSQYLERQKIVQKNPKK